MDVPTRNSNCSCCDHGYSLARCSFFLLFSILFVAAMFGAATFIIILVLKPKTPIFSIQKIRLDSFELHNSSSQNVYFSSIVSLTLSAQNPNKVEIRYSPSQLRIFYTGIPIGLIQVPQFDQPSHSKNISVQTQVVSERVNINQITDAVSLEDSSRKRIVNMRILGDVKAHVRVLHVTSPQIKVALDCEINVNYKEFILKKRVFSMIEDQDASASLLTNSQNFSKKCSFAVYI